jgi:hypothetical protein
MSTSSHDDPVRLIDTLDAAALERRISDLHRQEAALRVLLRAARARERRQAQEVARGAR